VPASWAIGGSATSNQGQGVKVAILDSGADATNPALTGRISWFKDYVAPSNSSPTDPFGHGTVIAQIIGGTADTNGSGSQFFGGVAPQSDLYVARVGDDAGNVSYSLIEQAIPDLLSQGIRIFNNSYGSDTQITSVSSNDTTVLSDEQVFGPAVSGGGLMVFAAGNHGTSQPSVEAGLPYYDPSLQSGWLAVVNVALDSNGQVTGLDTTVASNACGVAAAWCLAAPGDVYTSPVPGTAYSTGHSDGTSNSAAIVSGVAGLVWQRFPFFTANNVQETLLGTATALGDPALYGYGMVNADAAVRGPGKLDWGVFDVTMSSADSGTFSNNITGAGGGSNWTAVGP
jgi:subtilisin family serine protease